MPAAAAAAVKRRPRLPGGQATEDAGGRGLPRRPQGEDGGGGAVLEIAHVGGGALLVGLRAAHGHEDRILGASRGRRRATRARRLHCGAARLGRARRPGPCRAALRRAATRADSRPRPVSRRRSAVARMAAKASARSAARPAPAALGPVAPEPGQHAIGARAADRGAGQRGAEGDGGDHEPAAARGPGRRRRAAAR